MIDKISCFYVPARLPVLVLRDVLGNGAFREELLQRQRLAKMGKMESQVWNRVHQRWEFFRGSEYDLVLCEVLHVQHVDLIQMS